MAKCIECKNAEYLAGCWFCGASARTKMLINNEVDMDFPCREYKSDKEGERMFIEIDGKLINLDNVADIIRFGDDCIRICFIAERDYIDIKRRSGKELDKTWEWLKEACLRG